MGAEAQRAALLSHVETGVTTLCRCWSVTRVDGTVLAFTDHDRDLSFDGLTFRPDTGLEATALAQSTGLSVDNTEGYGVLSADAISEADIAAGRYDSAAVLSWLVNWEDPEARSLLFQGSIGEVRWVDGAFRAELRGLTEALNQPQGYVYQKPCSAVLGDSRCAVDLNAAGYHAEIDILSVTEARVFTFSGLGGFPEGHFARGRFRLLGGAGAGLIGLIKTDRTVDGLRVLELWQEIRADVAAGDSVRIEAGCDRRAETCRTKFDNYLNFRGFPHIPGEDWLTSYPKSGEDNSGGSMNGSSGSTS